MEAPSNILKGMICGLLFLAAVGWQFYIYSRCKKPFYNQYDRSYHTRRRCAERAVFLTFELPGLVSGAAIALTIVGALAFCILTAIDGKPVDWTASLKFVGAVLAVSAAFFLKQCINALLLGATVTWMAYQLLFNGDLSLIPVFRILFDFFASMAPDWVQGLYMIMSLGYALASALGISIMDFLSN